jgi:class 3 adenylate cyclase
MKIRQQISKLLLPLYFSFLFSLILSSMLSGFFEHYSNMPFQDITRLVRENSDSIRILFEQADRFEEETSPEVLEVEEELHKQFRSEFGEDMRTVDELLAQKYPLYQSRHPVGIMILGLLFWLWPVYRFLYKGEGEASSKVVARVMNLPTLLFILPWITGLWGLMLKIHYRGLDGIAVSGSMKANFIAAYFMYASLAGFINSWYTSRYINNGIAKKVFTGNQLYTLKSGKSMTLTFRILLLILSLGMIPLILNIYIPAVFNSWMFRSVFFEDDVDLVAVGQILGPLIITTIVNIVFLIAQLSSIISFRKNIQGPLNILIERMQDVAQGDFSTRTSVLSADELGNLKGHFNTMVEGLEEREKLRDTFGKFVSIEIARKLIETNEVDLMGEEIETTVMFADIRGFTSLSEGYTPRELIEFLNDYFSHMVNPIREEQGVINKFIGDCIMAIFSPVFGLENHADAAVRSALAMRSALEEFNAMGKYPPVRHGIGVHTGILIAGNVGSENRKEYTVIGDTVNLASRIESQTKVYETDILISEPTHKLLSLEVLNTFEFQRNKPVIVRGKTKPITLYSIK